MNSPEDNDTPHLRGKVTLALAEHAEVPALHERAVRVRLVGSAVDVAAARSSTCWFQPGALPRRFAAKQGWLTRTEWRDTDSGVEGEVLLANFSAAPERLEAGQSLGALSIAPAYEAAFVAPSELQQAVESEGAETGQRAEGAARVPSSDLPPSFVHGLDERMVPPIPQQSPHARVLARVQQLEHELQVASHPTEGVPFDRADLERRESLIRMTRAKLGVEYELLAELQKNEQGTTQQPPLPSLLQEPNVLSHDVSPEQNEQLREMCRRRSWAFSLDKAGRPAMANVPPHRILTGSSRPHSVQARTLHPQKEKLIERKKTS